MFPYYFVFSFLSGLTIFDLLKKRGSLKFFLALALVVILTFFAGFRAEHVDPDYFNYVAMYDASPSILEASNIDAFKNVGVEPGYYLINVLIKTISLDVLWVFLLTAFLAVSINLHFFWRYSPYFILSVAVYVSHVYINKEFIQIRAGLSGAILLASVPSLVNRKWFCFFSWVFVAASIHSAALIFIFLYMAYRDRIKNATYLIFLALSLFFALLISAKSILLFFDGLGLLPKIVSLYLSWERYNYALGLLNPITLKQVLVFVLLLRFRDILNKKIPYFEGMLFMYFLSTVWLIIFNDFAIIAARVATFLSIFDAILVSALVLGVKQRMVPYVAILAYAWTVLIINLSFKNLLASYEIVGGSVL